MITMFLVAIILLVWILAAGLWTVESGTIMAVKRLGRFNRIAEPGLNIIIPLVEKGEIFSTQTHQKEFPQIDKSGKKVPFRILQKGIKEAKFYKLNVGATDLSREDSYTLVDIDDFVGNDNDLLEAMNEDPLHSPLTSEVSVVVEWSLYNRALRVQRFIENIEPNDGRTREEEADKRIEDVIAKTLQEFLGVTTVGHARDRFPLLNSKIELQLERLVGEEQDDSKLDPKAWGINVTKAYIKDIDPGHTVNKARSEAAASVSEKRKAINAAEALAAAKVKDGDAEAQKIKAIGQAEKDAKILRNDADADQILRVIVPSAANDRTVEVVRAFAYRDNPHVIAVGGTPLINTSPK